MAKKTLKIKTLLFCLCCVIIFSVTAAAQNLSRKQINLYAKNIDKLKIQNKLAKYFYPNKSSLGALYGFYSEGKLVYMEATDGGDQLETRYFIYLKDEKVYKFIYRNYEYDAKFRPIYTGKMKVLYPKDLADGDFLESLKSCLNDLGREKVLEK